MRTGERKPLLGFGWVGWIGASMLVALIVVALAGYDFQRGLFETIEAWLGLDAMFAYVVHVHIGLSLSVLVPTVSIVDFFALCAALFIQPNRIRKLPLLLLVAWVINCSLRHWLRLEGETIAALFPNVPPLGVHWSGMLGIMGRTTAFIALIWWLTASWRVAATLASAYFVMWIALASMGASPAAVPINIAFTWAWRVVFAAAMLAWAIHARRNYSPGTACAHCGYSLRDRASETCPECGLKQPTTA